MSTWTTSTRPTSTNTTTSTTDLVVEPGGRGADAASVTDSESRVPGLTTTEVPGAVVPGTDTTRSERAATSVLGPEPHPALSTASTGDERAGEEVLVDTATLMDRGAPRPTHRGELADELRCYLEAELGDLQVREGRRAKPLWISKGTYSMFAACETYAISRRAERFTWSEAAVLGTVADRAVANVLGSTTAPTEAVEAAITTLEAAGDDLARYLKNLGPSSRDLLVLQVGELLSRLVEVWPLYSRSIYDHQVRLRVSLAGGAVVLSGVPDVVLGRLREPSGQSRALVLDWKSGQVRPEHRVEQRFYALLVTLQAKRPPWRVATYYLAAQGALLDEVDEALLWETARAVTTIVRRIAATTAGDVPRRQGGPQCRWCGCRATCPVVGATSAPSIATASEQW